jgi:HD-like signal output (HDOD) protein
MSTEVRSNPSASAAIEELVRRARALYSLPTVAARVIELTGNPRTDAQALNECIHTDPALAAKILRVVNSSLFGMRRKVCNLNQAIALLGTKPLKMLVLGFSLPEKLFREVAQEQLNWYWSTTLSRAVAARAISEQLFGRAGDEPFLAALLQDIGVLVLLGELREAYTEFLARVIDRRVDLQRLEVDSLGFDHRTLSSRLLEHWNMPELLVDGIAETTDVRNLAGKKTPTAEVAQILHLAGLIGELVGHNRLSVLPELMEAGKVYCGLDDKRLNQLVVLLQPKVEQLAEVLSLELPQGRDYGTLLAEAYRQMSELNESVAGLLIRSEAAEDDMCADLAGDVVHLRAAVDRILHTPVQAAGHANRCGGPRASVEPELIGKASEKVRPSTLGPARLEQCLVDRLAVSVGRCRARRQPISVLLIEAAGESAGDNRGLQILEHVLAVIHRAKEGTGMEVEPIAPRRKALVLPGWERQHAVRLAEDLLCRVEKAISRLNHSGAPLTDFICAGVASVALPSKNFLPQDLIETAGRCLAAAELNGDSVVKSLEIF